MINEINPYYTDALLCSYAYSGLEYTFDQTPYDKLNNIIKDIKTTLNNTYIPSFAIEEGVHLYNKGQYDHKEASCLVREDNNNLYLVFRGTDALSDTLHYFSFDKYYNLYKPLIEKVLLHHEENPEKTLRVSGHSLGGAMVDHFVHNNLERLKIINNFSAITFGTPGTKLDPELPIIHFTHHKDGVSNIADIVYNIGKKRVNIEKNTNSLYSHFSEEYAYSMKILKLTEKDLENQFKLTENPLKYKVEQVVYKNISMAEFYSVHLKHNFNKPFQHFNKIIRKTISNLKKNILLSRIKNKK